MKSSLNGVQITGWSIAPQRSSPWRVCGLISCYSCVRQRAPWLGQILPQLRRPNPIFALSVHAIMVWAVLRCSDMARAGITSLSARALEGFSALDSLYAVTNFRSVLSILTPTYRSLAEASALTQIHSDAFLDTPLLQTLYVVFASRIVVCSSQMYDLIHPANRSLHWTCVLESRNLDDSALQTLQAGLFTNLTMLTQL